MTSQNQDKKINDKSQFGNKVILRNVGIYFLYKKMISMTVLSLIVAIFCLFQAIYFVRQKSPPQYIPVTQDGRIIPIVPLNEPNSDDSNVFSLGLKAIQALNTYDYINWKEQLQQADKYFTPAGWGEYLTDFQKTQTINTVLDRKMIVSSSPTGPVSLIDKGVSKNGIYFWKYSIPVEIIYTATGNAQGGSITQIGNVNIISIRMPITISSDGLGIQSYVFIPKSNG